MPTAPLIPPSELEHTGSAALVVALSGGLDSTVLLHALAAMPAARARGLRALHVHHGLHADADAWQHHCETTCRALQVPLRSVNVDVARDGDEGLEAAARHARHAAFADELGAGEVLVLAHHRDDQAETFLMRALRGSGVDGLGAMQPWRAFARGWLWRPLLDRPRAELQAYALAHGLRWIEDPGNIDTRFDRNFLRQRVLPLLRERWPQADASFARSAALCADATALLDEGDRHALAQLRTADPRVLDRDALRALAPARRARVLRRWIAELGLPPLPIEGIAHVEAEILPARDDADPQFAWHGVAIRAWRDLLHADRRYPTLPSDWRCEWDGSAPVLLPGGGEFGLVGGSRFDAPLVVHARQGGERITLPARDHSHALKHVLQDLGVPPWERERLPLLSDTRGELLAAGDLVYSAGFDSWLRRNGARLYWLRD
jgi:tRNA(Ile)-lysidine synthase